MNPLKQLAGQTAIYGLSSVIARILNFLLVPFYTRVFVNTAEYGIVNELYAYVAFFIIILTYGMETAFFRFSSKNADSQLVFTTSLLCLFFTSIIFALLVIIFYPSIGYLIGYQDKQKFILLLGLVLSFDAIAAIPFARLRLHNYALKFALIKLFNISINIFFNVLFLVFIPWLISKDYGIKYINVFYDSEFRVGYVFFSNLMASFFTLLFFIKDIFKTQFRFSFKLLRSMLFYSYPLLIAGLAGTVNEVIDRVMLKYRLPDCINALEQIGIYGANIKIAVLMALFVQMFRYASEPFFFSQEKNSNNRELYAKVLHYFTITGIFVFLIIALYIDIFKYIIGFEYREGIKIVPVVLLGYFMLGIYFNLSVWYKLKELTIFGAIFATSGAVITLAVNYFFIPKFGYMASAWGHLLAYSFMSVLAYQIGRFYYPVPYNIKSIFLYIVLGVLIYAISAYIEIDTLALRLAFNTFFILMFAIFVLFKENELVKSILKR